MKPNLKNERIGAVNKNNFGSLMKVIQYNKANDILVQFSQGKPIKANWKVFSEGKIISPYDKTVFNIGYLGEGEFRGAIEKKATKQYSTWYDMMKRCYSKKFKENHPTYKGCTVDDEWHNFQNFAKWYDDNFYKVGEERMNLDKDILIKGNKIYSPETCVFVPRCINLLFTKKDANRGNSPIGVYKEKRTDKYVAACTNEGEQCYIGTFESSEDAFLAYKSYKEQIIKIIANKYKGTIPNKLYNSMITYQVEITD